MSVTPTPSELADRYDTWLRSLVSGLPDGVALAAVGGLGRREPAPHGDLDLLLLHTGRVRGIAAVADAIWYPIWDAGVALDHSVRTPDQALDVARGDLKALLGLVDVRHIAGDARLTTDLRDRLLRLWRTTAAKRADELHELCRERWARAGEAAFLLEPNLKESRGGLRDSGVLRALALAQLVDVPAPAREARAVLLDVRGELHRATGRSSDVLRLQDQAELAAPLGLSGPDDVLRTVHEAARAIAYALDLCWRRIGNPPARRVIREPLAEGVVAQDGEVVLARDADPSTDPGLLQRAARAAAERELPIAPFALARLAAVAPGEPWPDAARADLVGLLGTGGAAVPVLESLDQAGLLVRLIPEWAPVRFAPQHNPVHRYTVDRHLMETAAQAAALTRDVARPDLLLLGALLHDIGKGYPGDHSVAGARIAARVGERLGLPPQDVATVAALARHHLLLPDTATRRDLDDPATTRLVVDAVGGDAELLALLHALTIADALATGPAAWSDWKEGLVADLVRRSVAALDGGRPPAPAGPLDAHLRRLADAGRLAVEVHGADILVAAPDRPGLLSRTAGVLALHGLDVRSASVRTYAGMAVNEFAAAPRFGRLPDAAVLRAELARALDGDLDLAPRLAAKEAAYDRAAARRPPPTVHWFDGEATGATVLEVRTDDAIGLLYRLTAALERCGLDIRAARVSSLGRSVVDAFYVTTTDGAPVDGQLRPDVEAELNRP